MSNNAKIDWQLVWQEHWRKVKEDITVLPHFLKNPVKGMRQLPDWHWPTILFLQGIFAIAISIVTNALDRDFLGLISGIIVAPLANYVVMGIACGFFYYVFMFFFGRVIRYREIYLNVLFAAIPVMLVACVSSYVAPLVLLGSAASLMLLFVGFVHNFDLPIKHVRNLLLGLFAMHALYWGFQQVRSSSKHKSLRQMATPESLDILEKELNQ